MSELKHYGLGWVVFQFGLLVFFAHQVQFIVTSSSWPPARWFRIKVREHYGTDSAMTDFWTCPNCVGFWLTLAVFAWASWLLNVPLPILQTIAGARLVGFIGSRDG